MGSTSTSLKSTSHPPDLEMRPKSYFRDLPKATRVNGLRGVLTYKFTQGDLHIVDELDLETDNPQVRRSIKGMVWGSGDQEHIGLRRGASRGVEDGRRPPCGRATGCKRTGRARVKL
jgi:hypothetical protein